MRRILFFLLVLCATLFATQRAVVLENFTATWCQYCPGQARAQTEIYHRSYDSVVVISYHPSASDPFYSAEAVQRLNYYNVTGYPKTYFDGVSDFLAGGMHYGTMYPFTQNIIHNRLRTFSPLDISLSITYQEFDRTGTVTAKIKNTSGTSRSGTVHFVIVESHKAYAWQDMDSLQFVMRDMLPNATGESVTIAAGDSVTKSRNFSIAGGWNEDNCDIVVFVQAADRTIYQGAEIAFVNDPDMEYYGMEVVETSGNGNGVAEPGESAVLRMSAKNMGDGTYTGGATVSTSDTYITIDSSNSQTVSIERSEVDTVIHTYITISGACPDPHQPEFVLDFGSPSDTVPFIVTSAPGISDDVESGQGGWTHSGILDNWHITAHKSNSPTHSWYCGYETIWHYIDENDASLISPYFVVTPDSSLTFYHQYVLEADWDYGYVEVDNGSGWWKTLSVLTGTQSAWTQASYPLNAYNGETIRMRFRFISDGSVTAEGWYVDDILMKTHEPADNTPPASPLVTKAEKTGSDVKLYWNMVTTDTSGFPETMGRYVIYRSASPDFIPASPDSIGGIAHPDTEYTDTGALTGATSYYYLVKAVDNALNRGKKSNMAYAMRKTVVENASATDRN